MLADDLAQKRNYSAQCLFYSEGREEETQHEASAPYC
jgi:hypothetical protein